MLVIQQHAVASHESSHTLCLSVMKHDLSALGVKGNLRNALEDYHSNDVHGAR